MAGRPVLNRSVFLVGPMGAGKTTIGRHLARTLRLEFIDSDHEIERRTGATIPWIFDIEGEAGFRRREQAVIDDLTMRAGIVLATGGGAVLDPANRRCLHERGTVVYLRATLDELLRRTARDRNRPLLQTDNPRAKLEALLQVREPLYREVAHIVIDTGSGSVASVVRRLVAAIRNVAGDGKSSGEAVEQGQA